MIYFSEKKGLTIILTPAKFVKNEYDKINTTPGKRVQFNNGRYFTKDEEEIKLLERYMKKKPNIIRVVDEEYEMLESKYMAEAKEQARQAYEEAKTKAMEEAKKRIKEKNS